MNEFFANILSLIELLVWSDWATIIILLAFLILGFKRGLAKELINFGFLLFAIIMAVWFYQPLAINHTITWLELSHQSHMAIAFGAIFIGVLLIKKIIYKLTNASSSVKNPCALNKTLTHLIFFVIAIAISWNYFYIVADLDLMNIITISPSTHNALAFFITFAIIISLYSSISNMLNIAINTPKTCFLSAFFTKILNTLHFLDEKLNAKNINSNTNNIGGLIIGLVKGSLAILIMVLVFQSIDNISQQYYWIETNGALKAFQDVGLDIKPILSEYLLFIKND
jgi:uncharacterized membrane protein required for colicin V production